MHTFPASTPLHTDRETLSSQTAPERTNARHALTQKWGDAIITAPEWREWISEERTRMYETTETPFEGRNRVLKVAERAVANVYGITCAKRGQEMPLNTEKIIDFEIWRILVDYVTEDIIAGEDEEDRFMSIEEVRNVIERAVKQNQGYYEKIHHIFELQNKFENAVHTQMLETPQDQEKIKAAYRRQATQPNLKIEEAFGKYTALEQNNTAIERVRSQYEKACVILKHCSTLEKALDIGGCSLESFETIIASETAPKKPDLVYVSSLFERTLSKFPTSAFTWEKYLNFLCVPDHKLRTRETLMPVLARATLHCPWYINIWIIYLYNMEHFMYSEEEFQAIFTQAMHCGFTEVTEYISLSFARLEYFRRKLYDNQGASAPGSIQHDADKARQQMRKICKEQVKYLDESFDSDAAIPIQTFWASIEADLLTDLTAARKIMEYLLKGRASQALLWLHYIDIESRHGDTQSLRKVYKNAAYLASDWPESIWQKWLEFERINGNLEDIELATRRILERREHWAKQAVKEKPEAVEKDTTLSKKPTGVSTEAPSEVFRPDPEKTAFISNLAPGTTETHLKVFFGKDAAIDRIQIKETADKVLAYVNFATTDALAVAREKKDRSKLRGRQVYVSQYRVAKPHRDATASTLFISNLPKTVTKASLSQVLAQFGEIQDVRVISKSGRHIAYAEYMEESSTTLACEADGKLTMDSMQLDIKLSKPTVDRTHQRSLGKPGASGHNKRLKLDTEDAPPVASEPAKSLFVPTTVKKSNADFRSMLLGTKK